MAAEVMTGCCAAKVQGACDAPIMPTSVERVMSATTGLCAVWVLTTTPTPCRQISDKHAQTCHNSNLHSCSGMLGRRSTQSSRADLCCSLTGSLIRTQVR